MLLKLAMLASVLKAVWKRAPSSDTSTENAFGTKAQAMSIRATLSKLPKSMVRVTGDTSSKRLAQ
jgi:hypothetical protein